MTKGSCFIDTINMDTVAPLPVNNPAPKKKSFPTLLIFLILLVAAIAFGFFYLKSNQQYEETQPSPATTTEETKQSAADETKVNVSLSDGEEYVTCSLQSAASIEEAVSKSREAFKALDKCKSEDCIKNFTDADSNLLSLIKQYCKQ